MFEIVLYHLEADKLQVWRRFTINTFLKSEKLIAHFGAIELKQVIPEDYEYNELYYTREAI